MSWILWCILLFIATGLRASAANILYLDKSDSQSDTRHQIETAAHFYGLDVDWRLVDRREDRLSAVQAISNAKTVAVIISAEALATFNKNEIFKQTRRGQRKIPILISGINAHSNSSLLQLWSSGAVTGSRSSSTPSGGWYEIAVFNDVTRQLGGSKFPLNQKSINSLIIKDAQNLMEAKSTGSSLPVFVRTEYGANEVFFSVETQVFNIPVTPNPYRQQALFAAIASPMMFLRYAGGERAWHSPGEYANFTIDDLWLREPYGHVDFKGLLREAQIHNFHATVAFIPWNYDRSQSEVVSLFRAHADRLSICVHGNNHVHQEFGPFEEHPLDMQEKNIRQAIARMDKFKQLTNVSYDPVMVFPHSISPEGTLAALKRANYLATANSLNVPSDVATPPDVDFALRTSSLHFANFPSLRRYSAESELPRNQLAIDAFLGNPMLFYAHESFFTSGINAFNSVADTVNQLQPDTQWRSLGDIVQRLYLEKLRDDGNFDVRAYSSSIRITNRHEQSATFFVEKEEDFSLPLTVLVDGQKYSFKRDQTMLRLQLSVARGNSKLIEVKYGSHAVPVSLANSMTSPKVAIIRLLSDFRDNVVSNTSLGRRCIRSYANNVSKWNRRMAVVALFFGVLIICLYMRRISRLRIAQGTSH